MHSYCPIPNHPPSIAIPEPRQHHRFNCLHTAHLTRYSQLVCLSRLVTRMLAPPGVTLMPQVSAHTYIDNFCDTIRLLRTPKGLPYNFAKFSSATSGQIAWQKTCVPSESSQGTIWTGTVWCKEVCIFSVRSCLLKPSDKDADKTGPHLWTASARDEVSAVNEAARKALSALGIV